VRLCPSSLSTRERDLEELVIQLRRQVTSLTKENKMLSSEQARSNKEIKSLLRDNAALREERRSIRMALGFDSKFSPTPTGSTSFGRFSDKFSPPGRAMAA